ncbi:hypothetical protein DW083_14580 [Parabacteroides sp. AF48-14]|uniref:hypothetical protein n=1 Tax=Parabacteroides sp. AF48-14 TaxID=2292052 RepID=UPI000EFE6ED8|nr:hypothetical protein [Parabacteroides sp. AF48-14]RHO70003.1 hypothetical protein DW083_14580 [Parabacteroides sp. AF48-14]
MMRKILQYILDRLVYFLYRNSVVIGNFSHFWCNIPIPISYPQQSQTHPSILYIKQGWNGATHWLGTTPYPNAQIEYENPCIYYANVLNEELPIRFIPIEKNPILDWPGGDCFNSDIELYYADNVLYSIIREYDNSTLSKKLKVQYSEDGQHWSKSRLFFETIDPKQELLSPSIIQHKGKLRLYCLNGDAGISKRGNCTGIHILEGDDLKQSAFKEIATGIFTNKEQVRIEPWHCCLFEYQQKLYMLFCGRDHKQKTFRSPMETYLAVSEDYQNFYIYEKPIVAHIKTYRPSAYIDGDQLHLYFSVVGYIDNFHEDRRIGYTCLNMKELLKILQ